MTACNMSDKIRIHSIETLGALDGPGIRTVIFFQGCPMRCAYCHNADTFDPEGGKEESAEALAAFCERYKNFYGNKGGVTLSGGEPLMQRDGATALMRLLGKKSIHTALDTAGSIFAPEALDAADLVILDIKHTDKNAFKALTGYPADNSFKTLEYLQKNKRRFWVRQVILGGVTDDPAQVRKLKEIAFGAEKIELLPFHKMGENKWKTAGVEYTLYDAVPPSNETMERLRAELEK